MNRRAFTQTLAGAALGAASYGKGRLLEVESVAHEAAASEGEAAGIPFKLSVMLWTVFEKLPFEQRLEKIAEAGYRNVELVGEYEKWLEEDYRKANRKRRELGITFDTMAGAGDLVDPRKRENFLADIRKALKVAEKIECPSMICFSGDVVPDMPREAQQQSVVEGLKRAAEIVEGKNMILLLENIDLEEDPNYYLWSVPEGFEIVRKVNHPQVTLLLDFFHAQISGGNLITNLQKNIDKVGLVHIADVPGRHEPGTGEINYANIFKKLAELKYSHYAAMEFIPSGDPMRSLRAAREMALGAARG